MGGFFDPNPRAIELFPMYGTGHLIALGIMLAFVPLMVWQKDAVIRLRNNRKFMVWLSVGLLAGEINEYTQMIVHNYEPAYEILPFHLCGTLAIVLPILTLTKSYKALRFLATWAVAAGLISLLNLGITHNDTGQLTFYHYFWRHYYLFLFPIFLFIAGEYEFTYGDILKSILGLLGYSLIVFLANWAFGTNYMYTGQNNELAVPFIPDSLMVWPLVYPSFIVVGLALFHVIYAGFALAQMRRLKKLSP